MGKVQAKTDLMRGHLAREAPTKQEEQEKKGPTYERENVKQEKKRQARRATVVRKGGENTVKPNAPGKRKIFQAEPAQRGAEARQLRGLRKIFHSHGTKKGV